MKAYIRGARTSVLLLVATGFVFALATFLVLSRFAMADDAHEGVEGGTLVTIHDRAIKRVVLAEGRTIGDAIKQAGFEIDPNDNIEPSLDQELVASEYQVNIYRARPVVIVDGSEKATVVTAFQTAKQIVESADIEVYDEDILAIERADIGRETAGLKVRVDRATPFTLDLYGSKTTVRSHASTVAEFLEEKEITLQPEDKITPAPGTELTSETVVKIWREGKQVVTVEEDVEFDRSIIYSADQLVGYSEIISSGVLGQRTVTYEIVTVNGVEFERQEISSVITKQPKAQVERIGINADRATLMSAAGIAESDFWYVQDILNRENGMWCPLRWQGQRHCPTSYAQPFVGAENSNQIGYGMCQATPASKMASAGADWRTNPVTQLKWCSQYAIGRYGSWENAQTFSSCIGNCYNPYTKGYTQKRTRWW
jgi:uncharacterized protein YabE (DUF348 family)